MRNFFRLSLMMALVMGLLAFSASGAKAVPLTGAFSINGNYVPVNGATGVVVPTIGQATGIDFIVMVGDTPTPGVAGAFLVTQAEGDFAFVQGLNGLIKDFTFTGAGSVNYPNVPILAFESVGGVTFDLLTIGVTFQDMNSLILDGTGIFHLAGFDPTPGTFTLTSQQGGTTFSFSASNVATNPIPEPASMLLLGTGLAGVAGAVRRKLKARNQA